MAITFVNASSNSGDTVASLVVNKPSGVVDGDVMVMVAATAGTTITTPSGWTLLQSDTTANGYYVWMKTAASEPASYTLTPATSKDMAAAIVAYRGALGTPNVSLDSYLSTTGTPLDVPNTTSTVANCMALHIGAYSGTEGLTIVPTSPAVSRVEVENVANVLALCGIADEQLGAAGAVTGRDWSLSTGKSGRYGAIVLLAPAPTAVGKTLQAIWNVRAPLGDTLQAIWGVRTALGDTLQAQWAVRSALGDTVGLLWNVRAAIADSADLRWDTRAAVADTLALQWGVRTSVADTLALLWSVRSALGDTVSLPWDVRAALGDSLQALWNVRSAVGDTADLRWDTRAAVGDSIEFLWDVDVSGSAVGVTLSLVWDVRAALGDTADLRWGVRTSINDSLDTRWGVRTAVGDDADLRWAIRSALADTLALEWGVRTSVSDTLILPWDVRAAAGDALALEWALRAATSADLGLLWDVLSSIIELPPPVPRRMYRRIGNSPRTSVIMRVNEG